MKSLKVLILYNKLFNYRIPIFNLLSEKCDLTVAYSLGECPKNTDNLNFKIHKFKPISKFGPFIIHQENIYNYCQNFDIVIAYGEIAWLKYSTLAWFKSRKFKIIYWSIGVSASYSKGYDAIKKWDSIRDFFYKKADAMIFYSEYPVIKNLKKGYSINKMFVAPNTVLVLNTNEIIEKDSILFIGTLYRQKGLGILLEAYKSSYKTNPNIPLLNIVGGGDESELISKWIKSNDLTNKVQLCGPIYDENIKLLYFKRAFACISPSQAGLAVLESMGHGVPFITSKNAITGGEIFNIEDGKNGILLESPSQLSDIIIDITNNTNKYIQMGKDAQEFYNFYRKPSDMVEGFISAINYVSRIK